MTTDSNYPLSPQPGFISLPVSHHCFYCGAQTTKPLQRSSFKRSSKPTLDTELKKAEQKKCAQEKFSDIPVNNFITGMCSAEPLQMLKSISLLASTLCSMSCLYGLTPAALQCLFMACVPLGNDRLFPDLYRSHTMMSKQKP